MAWLTNFYRRRKNPWVGFVLVLLFGPFGFLYHSWKTTIYVFLVGPLWIIFLRHTRFDLIGNPWAHYIGLVILASFALLQINGRNSNNGLEKTKAAQNAQILELAISLLPNDVERKAFQDFLSDNPLLSEKLQKNPGLLFKPEDPFTRWQIALLLSSYSTIQAEAGDFSPASGSLIYSMLFFEENPLAWAGMAELYTEWEDRIGARWANKVLKFKPAASTSEMINRVYSDPASLAALQDMKERMLLLMRTCAEHPEWRDSYPLARSPSYCRDL